MFHEAFFEARPQDWQRGPFANFTSYCQQELQDPNWEKEPVYRAMALAIVSKMSRDPVFESFVGDLVDKFGAFGSPYIFEVSRAAIQANEMAINPNYPDGFDNSGRCEEAIDRAMDSANFGEFFVNCHRGVPSNKADRYKLIKLVDGLSDEAGTSVLDLGCSANQGLKLLSLYPSPGFGFKPVEVVDLNFDSVIMPGDGQILATTNHHQTEFINRQIANQNFNLSVGVGVDIQNPNAVDFQKYVRGSSFHPHELATGCSELEDFDRLAAAEVDNVYYFCTDITDPDGLWRPSWNPTEKRFTKAHAIQDDIPNAPEKFDWVNFSFVFYQLPKNDRPLALKNALDLAKEDGKISILDSGNIKESGSMRFCSPRLPWRIGFWVFDKAQPHLGFQRYVTAENGRILRVRIEPALGQLALSRGVDF